MERARQHPGRGSGEALTGASGAKLIASAQAITWMAVVRA